MTQTPFQTPSQAERWLQAPAEAAFAVLNGWVDYAAGATEQGRITPLHFLEDATRWWQASTVRTPPRWSTRHREVRRWPEARLLDFSSAPTAVPTLILPPQAGHASTIVDYSAAQSQVRTARDAGLTSVFCLDWLAATKETAGSSIEEYVAILDDAIALLGGKVHLVGDCQGGWLAAIYAALRPYAVASLALGGAPIDFHAGSSAIQEWVRRTSANGELGLYRTLVELGGGNHRGRNQITGFKMLEPAEEIVRLSGLWGNIHDPAHVQRYVDFTNWFEWAQDVPGQFYLWIVEHLFIRNELVQQQLLVGGDVVDLAAIDVPLHLLAGTSDHITPAPQLFALADAASTPEEKIHRHLVDAGHLGLFMGRTSLAGAWTEVFQSLAQQSEA